MATVTLGAEPAPLLEDSTILERKEQVLGYYTQRSFHYPNFNVKGENGTKHSYDLRVSGRLSDLGPEDLWNILWEGNTIRTSIGDRVKEIQDADPNYANRVEHQIHLAMGGLLEWVELKAGRKQTRSAVAKDSKIALQQAKIDEQSALILSLMEKIDALLAKQEQAV